MKKRWLSLTLALVFCLSLVPGVTMTAGAATSYNLFLGDVEVYFISHDGSTPFIIFQVFYLSTQ